MSHGCSSSRTSCMRACAALALSSMGSCVDASSHCGWRKQVSVPSGSCGARNPGRCHLWDSSWPHHAAPPTLPLPPVNCPPFHLSTHHLPGQRERNQKNHGKVSGRSGNKDGRTKDRTPHTFSLEENHKKEGIHHQPQRSGEGACRKDGEEHHQEVLSCLILPSQADPEAAAHLSQESY